MKQIWIALTLATLVLVAPHAKALETISGTVRDAAGTALSGIDIDVYVQGGAAVTIGLRGTTDLNGTYSATLPGPGTYIVRADAAVSDGVVDQWSGGAFLRSGALPISVSTGDAVSGIDFSLAPGVTLSGVVTGSGTGQAGIDLDLYDVSGEFLSGYPGTTNPDGSYTLGALPPGNYLLKADPNPAQLFVRSYFGGAMDKALATPIAVGASPVAGIDIALVPGGTLSGRITNLDGIPIADIDIDLFDTLGTKLSITAKTNPLGSYEIGPLPAGDYLVLADPTLAQGYAVTFFDAAPIEALATPVTAIAGVHGTGVNFILAPGSAIRGQIVEAGTSRTPLVGIDLDIFDATGRRLKMTAKTGAGGFYAIGPLPAGEYLLRADPTLLEGYARQYYAGSATEADASFILVSAGVDRLDVDFTLPLGATISGTIRSASSGSPPLAGIDLDVFDALGSLTGFSAKTDATGHYRVGPMQAGTYFVRADPALALGYAEEFYINEVDVRFATPIPAIAGADQPNIDFDLEAAGAISGRVLVGAQPVPGIDLDLYDAATGLRLRRGAVSDATGGFRFDSLTAGTYKFRADPTPADGYALRYYDAKTSKALADVLIVVAGVTTSAADLQLEIAATISGRVVSAADGLPIPDIDLDLFTSGTLDRLDQSARTDINGDFTIAALPAGSYILRADPVAGQPYARTYWDGARSPATATAIQVASGDASTGIVLALPVPEPGVGLLQFSALLVLAAAARSRQSSQRTTTPPL